MQILFNEDDLHDMSDLVFSEKLEKQLINFSSAEIAMRGVRLNDIKRFHQQ